MNLSLVQIVLRGYITLNSISNKFFILWQMVILSGKHLHTYYDVDGNIRLFKCKSSDLSDSVRFFNYYRFPIDFKEIIQRCKVLSTPAYSIIKVYEDRCELQSLFKNPISFGLCTKRAISL